MGLFGINRQEELEQLQAEQRGMFERYNKLFAGYSQEMKQYTKQTEQLREVLETYESKEREDQMDRVQVALDLKYLKEQGEQFQEQGTNLTEQLKLLSEGQVKLIRKQTEGMQQSLESLVEQQKAVNERFDGMERKISANKRLLIFTTVFGFFNLCSVVFLILYLLEVIVF